MTLQKQKIDQKPQKKNFNLVRLNQIDDKTVNSYNSPQMQKENSKNQFQYLNQQNINEDLQLFPDLREESLKELSIKKKVTYNQDCLQQQLLVNSNAKQSLIFNCENGKQLISFQEAKQRLQKFSNFINYHEIGYKDIWFQCSSAKNRQLSFSLNQFCTKLHQSVGYYLTNHELAAIMSLLTAKDLVKPQDFAKIGLWKQNLQRRYDPFAANGNTLSLSLTKTQKGLNNNGYYAYSKLGESGTKKSKIKLTNNLNQPKSILKIGLSSASSKQNLSISTRNINAIKHQQKQIQIQEIQLNNILNYSSTTINLKKSSSKIYSLAKSKQKIENLKNDIKSNVLQKKWDFVVMVGEMNQWIQKINSKSAQQQLNMSNMSNISKFSNSQPTLQVEAYPIRYKIYNHPEDGTFKISLFDKIKNSQQEIPEIVFIKKYESLKKKMKAQVNHKNNLKGTVLMVLQDSDKLTKNTLATRLDQRDQELNYVLLQIMRMKSIFTHQLKILKENNINT